MAMARVFGPVSSRRLGRSLGLDPLPGKTCNFNCVYCQLGRTPRLSQRRRLFVPPAEILAELEAALKQLDPAELDWISLVGSGETTLFAGLGELIAGVKAMSPTPVAVFTNSSLLHLERVRHELLEADAVLPSLDAGNAALFRRLNRAHPGIDFDPLVEGLKSFVAEFSGPVWLEVMLVAGLNDSVAAVSEIAAVAERIAPAEIHLLTPVRPPAEAWVSPPSHEVLQRAASILGRAARVLGPRASSAAAGGATGPLGEAVLAILIRHPMRVAELEATLGGATAAEIGLVLAELEAARRVHPVDRYGLRFWARADSQYAVASTRPS